MELTQICGRFIKGEKYIITINIMVCNDQLRFRNSKRYVDQIYVNKQLVEQASGKSSSKVFIG